MESKVIKTPSKGKFFGNRILREKIRNFTSKPIGRFIIFGIILIAIGMMALNNFLFPYTIYKGIADVCTYAIMAIGFCLLMGYSGLASLGTSAFAGVGAYVTFIIIENTPLGFFAALIASIVFAILLGLFVGIVSLRIEGMYLAIVTLAIGLTVTYFIQSLCPTATFKISSSISLLPGNLIVLKREGLYIISVVALVLLLSLTNNLINSPTGRAMLAMKNSTSAAQAMGISLLKYRLLAFIISTVYASIGGCIYIMMNKSDTPNFMGTSLFGLTVGLNVLGAVVIGGTKSLWGIIFGTLLVFGTQTIIFNKVDIIQSNPEFIGIITGLLIVIIVMFYPGGFAQLFIEVKAKIKGLIKKWRDKKYGTY